MKDEIKIAYKLVRRRDPGNPDLYYSFSKSKAMLHYRIGKKTTPVFGPLFLINQKDLPEYLLPYYEIANGDIFILECEYAEYPMPWNEDGYAELINPLVMAVVDRTDLILFWKKGIAPKSDMNNMFVHKDRTIMVFAKWAKPTKLFTPEEILEEWRKKE